MDSIFDKIKARASITEVVKHFGGLELKRSGSGKCPFHEDRNPSFSVKESEGIWSCFSGCGSGDAIDFVQKIKGISKTEAVALLADFYGISQPVSQRSKRVDNVTAAKVKSDVTPFVAPTARKNPKPKIDKDKLREYVLACKSNIEQTDYFTNRGLTDETIARFHLGYDAGKKAVVIPYSGALDYYHTRSLTAKEFRKPSTDEAGTEPLWNKKALSERGIVFVVESPICAMSIIQCGGKALSLCGTGYQKLLNECKTKKPLCTFVLSLDNDDPGQEAQGELAHGLHELGLKFMPINIARECKDPNDLLVKNAERLSASIKAAELKVKKEFSLLKDMFTGDELLAKDIPPARWIVHDLLPEGLTLLSSSSKFGKSWMMMQLAVAVAKGKTFLEKQTEQCGVAYFSLEDSERRFKGRLKKMLNGEAAGSNFNGSVKLKAVCSGLFEQLTELMENHPNMGLIIIDIFQKIRGGQTRYESAYAADYREMGQLKEFADKHKICLLLVHHLRKKEDDSDVFNRISGSMALMGACDTTWIMSRKKRNDVNTTLSVTGRDVEETDYIITYDKPSYNWVLVGNAEEEGARLARAEYEGDPVIKTIKALVEKGDGSWQGNCSDLKLKIYEETHSLYLKSPDTIGRTIRKYLDRLLADGIEHFELRGKQHKFQKKAYTLFTR